MSRKRKRTKGIEEARPFAGTPALHHTCPGGRCQGTQCGASVSRVNEDAAGVDIGAIEIVACVAGDEHTQIVKAFGNYYYPDALSGHSGFASPRAVAARTQRQNRRDGKHGRVLDSAI